MNFDNNLYNLTQYLAGPLFQAGMTALADTEPPPPIMQLRRGRAESPAWFMIQALEFDPEPISVSNLRVRDIYASDRIVAAILELLASEKWLDSTVNAQGEREYTMTNQGRSLVTARIEKLRGAVAEGSFALDTAELDRLAGLMARVIAASLAASEPPGNWCLRYSRNRAPAKTAPAAVQILQYTADFNAYRDDAHMAAWQPLAIEGHAWEAFSFICDGTANTTGAIDQKLHYRGHTAAEYDAVLQELVQRGWLQGEPGNAYQVTEAGQLVRREVEEKTDTDFFAPWRSALDSAEQEALQALMQKMLANKE